MRPLTCLSKAIVDVAFLGLACFFCFAGTALADSARNGLGYHAGAHHGAARRGPTPRSGLPARSRPPEHSLRARRHLFGSNRPATPMPSVDRSPERARGFRTWRVPDVAGTEAYDGLELVRRALL
jgi:hypothetical protein